ncbi:hypothetical protein [Streptomyces nigrescens]|uniref:hypothetical protein n=1 Tax=Streptomyces nigrescens TaxID=1920 RepID=UPI0036FBD488
MSAMTWLRVEGDRLVRADLITGLDLWGPSADHSAAIAGLEARIIAFVGTSRDDWAEVARVAKCEWGGDLITSLASALARASESTDPVRFVYGLYEGGALIGWASGPVIPVSDPKVRPWHTISDPAPGRWLSFSAGRA